jgi:3-oxoacyl-[acyl-carrier protein] reductase
MELDLGNRVYALTGASSGLGFATAECLVADGARVVICARDKTRLDDAVDRLNRMGGDGSPRAAGIPDRPRAAGIPDRPRAAGISADLGDAATPERLIEVAITAFGRLDGALLSVGGPPRGTAAQITDDEWRSAFETIFLGSVRAARAVVGRLAGNGDGGAVGFVLSSSVRNSYAGLGVSNGLRPGLAGVVKDMADEYGPLAIRVFGLLPHRILTERNQFLFDATGDPARAAADAESSAPLRRLGDPVEFGRVAAFLLSPAASYLTGLMVPVDGGAIRGI